MRFLRVVFTAATIALGAAACTPAEIADWWATAGDGTQLAPDVLEALSDWTESQDCLPGYEADQYTECAIVDSWHHYNVPVSLETWARIGWCESGLNPEARNPHSTATGLFQHLRRYWPARAAAAGWGDDILNARVNAFVSAWLASSSGIHHWNPSSRCW